MTNSSRSMAHEALNSRLIFRFDFIHLYNIIVPPTEHQMKSVSLLNYDQFFYFSFQRWWRTGEAIGLLPWIYTYITLIINFNNLFCWLFQVTPRRTTHTQRCTPNLFLFLSRYNGFIYHSLSFSLFKRYHWF